MSNPGLVRMMRAGMSNFHVGRAGEPEHHQHFNGEVFEFSATKKEDSGYNKKHDFSKQENREDKDKKADSDSDDDDVPAKKSKGNPIFKKGSDADSDGKTNEAAKNKVTDFSSKDGDDTPDAFQKGKKDKKDKKDEK